MSGGTVEWYLCIIARHVEYSLLSDAVNQMQNARAPARVFHESLRFGKESMVSNCTDDDEFNYGTKWKERSPQKVQGGC